MRKFIGYFVMFFPFLLAIGILFYLNWVITSLVILYTILALDIFMWFMWFVELGKRILYNEK